MKAILLIIGVSIIIGYKLQNKKREKYPKKLETAEKIYGYMIAPCLISYLIGMFMVFLLDRATAKETLLVAGCMLMYCGGSTIVFRSHSNGTGLWKDKGDANQASLMIIKGIATGILLIGLATYLVFFSGLILRDK